MSTTLTSVIVVARAQSQLTAQSSRISAFLDVSMRFSRDQALATGSSRLVQRVLERAFTTPTEELLVVYRWVWTALQTTIKTQNGLELVQCLVKFIHPSRSLWDAAVWAVQAKELFVLKWIYSAAAKKEGLGNQHQDALLREAVLSCELAIVEWLVDQRQADTTSFTTSSTTTVKSSTMSKAKTKPIDLGTIAKGTTFASEKTMTDTKWAIVELLLERLGVLLHRSLPVLAAKQGRLETIQKLKQFSLASVLPVQVCNAAASNGHFEIVTLLGGTPTDDAMDDAAMVGNLDVVQHLHTVFKCKISPVGVIRAADQGHTVVLQWLYETFHEQLFWKDLHGLLVPALWAAIDSNQLPAIQWLYETLLHPVFEKDPTLDRRVVDTIHMYTVIQCQSLAVLQFLHTRGLVNWDNWESHNAAYYADLPMWLWMHDQGLLGEPHHELQSAISGGRTECIHWILENRPRGTSPHALEFAALTQRMDLLELLVAKGYTGSFRAMDYAASKGFVDIVKFLYQHRLEDGASQAAIHGACLGGHLEVVQFLTDHAVPGATCSTTAMDGAASKNCLALVEYLHANRSEGCTVFAMDAAAANGNLAIVQFLHTHRTEGCSDAALENAAANGHFEMVQFLVSKYPHTFTLRAVQRARAKGEVEIALWLEQCSAAMALKGKRRGSSRTPSSASASASASAVAMAALTITLPPASPVF